MSGQLDNGGFRGRGKPRTGWLQEIYKRMNEKRDSYVVQEKTK
jgi:hypothetical protein